MNNYTSGRKRTAPASAPDYLLSTEKEWFRERFNSLRKNKLVQPRKIKQTLTSMLVNTPERTNFDVPLHKVALTCGSYNPEGSK
jgi:hypothetical protein